MRKIKVNLQERSYPILIGENFLSQVGKKCARLKFAAKCVIISDVNVASLYAQKVKQSLQTAGFDPVLVTVPVGETAKSLKTVQSCYDQLARHRIERNSFVVALGGGVVGDLAGFVAASYLRGIGFVQVPTTLLAQVDSSVGGKVGVNLSAGKNLVGAFYQPRLVLCDLTTLNTLSEREFRSGLAEVIKYGIIYDARLFRQIERALPKILRRDPKILTPIIARCCKIKADIVSQDETETGLRAILNFGHTVGHAIEAISGYGKYLHGEAISIGQVWAANLSEKLARLPREDSFRIKKLFVAADLPTQIKLSPTQQDKLLRVMQLDKKVSDGEIKFVLARAIGKVVFGQKIPLNLIRESLTDFAR
ncbi:MAG: 3-dehydroquinate synthase [Verrucomicrobiota bacterium]